MSEKNWKHFYEKYKQYLDLIQNEFDDDFYLKSYPDVMASGMNPFAHYVMHGAQEGRKPTENFNDISGMNVANKSNFDLFVDEVLKKYGLQNNDLKISDDTEIMTGMDAMAAFCYKTIKSEFDVEYYIQQNPDLSECSDPVLHYMNYGYKNNYNPTNYFDSNFYLNEYSDIKSSEINPFYHYICQGKIEGRIGKCDKTESINKSVIEEVVPVEFCDVYHDMHVYDVVKENFNKDFYLNNYSDVSCEEDAVLHYLQIGCDKKYDPSPDFSTSYYLSANRDVKDAGVNPYFHYIVSGKNEGRKTRKSKLAVKKINVRDQHQLSCSPGEYFEEFDEKIALHKNAKVKALAFYLPQFHAFEENDQWWGKGFCEWRNTARGLPRYVGHIQPRTPRDLGFYDLTDVNVMARQAAMAKAAGIYGFAFYYYSFNGKRLLDKPVNQFIENKKIDFPFMLIWANENWTKTWDGFDKEVLMSQDYRDEDEDSLLEDLARHFLDERYIRIEGRPLFVIYRPSLIPDAKIRFARWRNKWHEKHDIKPLIYMTQGFNDINPMVYGLDGAMEFPPHKVAAGLQPLNNKLELLDDEFEGNVLNYQEMIDRSVNEVIPNFPLIKGITLGWDNEARRPGRGMSFYNATPKKYENWLRSIVNISKNNPTHGESFIAINAWNEWAEGTYLEPDVHYGAAFLNATARALCNVPVPVTDGQPKIVLVGHDAYRHGAQILLLNIGKMLKNKFNMAVSYVILGDGPMIGEYRKIAECTSVFSDDREDLPDHLDRLLANGYVTAITNTTVSGKAVKLFGEKGFSVISLIHELPNLIREYSLEQACKDIADNSRHVVFPAKIVRDGFIGISGAAAAKEHILPQGLYNNNLKNSNITKENARKKLNIDKNAHVIINVGYADARKGFDIFAAVAAQIAMQDGNSYFIWVGGGASDVTRWMIPDLVNGPLNNKFLLTGFVENVEEYYAAADLFLMTSREDPFPSVVLEALQAGIPVVGFEDSGGCVELFEKYGSLVKRTDVPGIVKAVLGHLKMSAKKKTELAAMRRSVIENEYRFDNYCFDLVRMANSQLKKVSVVVPNYNYGYCIRERLDSIFNQSYPVFEIIVLDDVSTDNSVEVINEYAKEKQREIDLHVNQTNSGSVFRQWHRGALMARGEYLWIAEADDVASPLFLQKLVQALENSQGAFAFSDSWQIDTQGDEIGESYKAYINDGESGPFDNSFDMTGIEFIRQHLSIKNVILNVSGVLWRRQELLHAINAGGDDLYNFKVAGDWFLYIMTCSTNSKVSYVSSPLNGHRRHATSVTHALAKQKHYSEIVDAQEIAATFSMPDEIKLMERDLYRKNVKAHLKIEH